MKLRRWLAITLLCFLTPALPAHHILGIPHYAYDKNYPQAPVITYKVLAGPYVLELTGYPGKPVPGEMSEMHVYVYKPGPKKDVFGGKIEASVTREGMLGKEKIFGPVATRFEERLHKFSPIYKEAGKYRVRLEMQLEGQPYEVDFPILVGDPSSPLALLASWVLGLVAVIVVLRAIKIKRARRASLQGA